MINIIKGNGKYRLEIKKLEIKKLIKRDVCGYILKF